MLTILLDSGIRAIVLALMVWTVLRALRVSSPSTELAAWRLVLIAAIGMPWLTAAMHAITPALTIESAVPLAPRVSAVDGAGWSIAALTVYLGVATVLLFRQLAGLARGYRTLRRSARHVETWTQGLDVRLSDEISAPATFGATILLPGAAVAWDAAKREAVLAHERTHIRNRDFFLLMLARLYRAVFWFSPLAWWLPRRLAIVAEHLSDDAALETTSDHAAYAALLLEFARTPRRLRGGLGMAEGAIGQRIERILAATECIAATGARRRTLLVAAAIVPTVCTIAAFTLAQPGDVIPPRSNPLLPLSQPMYPTVARRLGEHGTVVLDLYVLSDGAVGDVRIKQSSGFFRLDESAAIEARNWRMDAGTVNGNPAASWGSFAVTFKLD